MPAHRSRTDRWRECLEQIRDREGGIELSLERGQNADGADVLWRVRLYDVSDRGLLVQMPGAAGQHMSFEPGAKLVGVMAIGQNRWMFHTRFQGYEQHSPRGYGRPFRAMRLTQPEGVERCRRREFYRISTAALNLAQVTCWPLLDPMSVVGAEAANRALINDLRREGRQAEGALLSIDSLRLPQVGPAFNANLVNLSGGGLGLVVGRSEGSKVNQLKPYWMTVDLRPGVPAPLGLTGRVVHTHMDSAMNTYCGVSFEFGFNPEHRAFVVEEIGRYMAAIQAPGRASGSPADDQRSRTAA